MSEPTAAPVTAEACCDSHITWLCESTDEDAPGPCCPRCPSDPDVPPTIIITSERAAPVTAEDGLAGTREAYLLECGQRERTTITENDLACARHRDTCPICQFAEIGAHADLERKQRTENARVIFVQELFNVQAAIEAGRIGDGEPVTIDQVDRAITVIMERARRAWTAKS